LVAERAQSGVQREDVSVTAKVGIDLLFAIALWVDGYPNARRPHIVEGVLGSVANEPLLFPANAGIQRHVLAHLPGIIDVGSVVFAGAGGDAAVKSAACLLERNLLVADARDVVVRA